MNGKNKTDTVKGVIENVVYRNESNDYTVLEIVTEDDTLVTAVGIIPLAFEGECVVLGGSWTYHKDFGKQFAFESYEKTLPEEVDGIAQYLSSGTIKGIGPVTALKIVNRFGKDSFDVIENHPEWLADINGITMKKAAAISESFRQQADVRGVMIFCRNFMGTGEITKVYKKLGSGAVGVIRDNPYILCDEGYGIPFERVDEFAKTFDFPMDSPIRVIAGIRYVLSAQGALNGHTCLPYDELVEATVSQLSLNADIIKGAIGNFISQGMLYSYRIGNFIYIMTDEVYEAEEYISRRLEEIDRLAPRFSRADVSAILSGLESSLGIEYANSQRQALYEAMTGGVMILTGGPGTGKTTVVKALVSIFENLSDKCVLAAPTGRAAKRMSEATSQEAKTIHRVLEMERSGDMRTVFGRNEKNPLEENVIIIDEASMIDLNLMHALVRSIKRGARLILIGDADQLPSVGAGNVFSDLIESGKIRTIRLTEVFRQSRESLIITNAHKINNGDAPVLSSTDNDFFFVRRESEREIPETVASLILKRLPRRYGSSIVEEIQVITPSKKGVAGVEALNKMLQAQMNPPDKSKKEKSSHGIIFRTGDKVMQTVNNYDLEWERNYQSGMGIFNGDIGIIDDISFQNNEMTIRFDDRIVKYPFENMDELDLAYAITVHKSQGSEYPVVVMPMYYCAPMLMSRNLFYTAVTRARRMVILVGRSDIPQRMVENNREIKRYTTLKDRILNY